MEKFGPYPLMSAESDIMAAMLAVKYYDHQAHKKPLTKASCHSFRAWQHSLVNDQSRTSHTRKVLT